MNGISKQAGSLRRRHVYEVLKSVSGLPPGYRNVTSALLMERDAHVLFRDSLCTLSAGDPDALLVCRSGVFALLFVTEMPTKKQINIVRHRSERLFGGVTVGSNIFVVNTIRLVLITPVGTEVERGDTPVIVADERTVRKKLFVERTLGHGEIGQIVKAVADQATAYIHLTVPPNEITPTLDPDGLFEKADAITDQRERALAEPLPTWLTFLDPDQLALVRKNYNGPARISGPAGTGKTVVALHRLARIARQSTGRLLMTSFVRTLPRYHETLFARLAPEVMDRVEFVGLHTWASQFLRQRGKPMRMEPERARTALALAWARQGGENSLLAEIEPNPGYWADEIDRVIKGRGITDPEEYATVVRTGREGLPLRREDQRPLVWDLFSEYRRICSERGIHDPNDLIAAALAELRDEPLDSPYGMVAVDEVQDVTLMGLRLVGAMAADTPNSLLFVGDGQQQVYPGGWRLSAAGFDIRNRGEVLRVNYRNRAAILDYAGSIDTCRAVDDLDGAAGVTLRDAHGVLDGGHVEEWTGAEADIDAALVDAIARLGARPAHVAVVTRTNIEANRFLRVLKDAGLPTQLLEDYDGGFREAVKIGTVQRVKGLEFPAVFRPILSAERSHHSLRTQRDIDGLAARRQLVAATRARDYLWLGVVDTR